MKLTDKQLQTIAMALNLAADYEDSLVDAYSGNTKEEAVRHAKINIRRFNRIRDRIRNHLATKGVACHKTVAERTKGLKSMTLQEIKEAHNRID